MFFLYLKSRAKFILLLIAVEVVFVVSGLLFDMPAVAVLYPLCLSSGIAVVAGAVDYIRVLNKHRALAVREVIPSTDLIENDYQKIIDELIEEEAAVRGKASSDYNNMVEYYTVWAHQIKTPIASMRLALQSEDNDTARRLEGDLNRIESYVEMVLTFLRLDSDSTDYVIRQIELDDVIRQSVRKYSRDFITKKLTMDFKPTGYKVITDDKWLSFVIEQIISNAVKYTSSGGISIRMDEPGVLVIKDTGIGIAPEDLPRIFENGFTGFNGREDKRASGIGLYLCKRICDNLGHGIKAESVPGEGTAILLDLKPQDVKIE